MMCMRACCSFLDFPHPPSYLWTAHAAGEEVFDVSNAEETNSVEQVGVHVDGGGGESGVYQWLTEIQSTCVEE